MLGEDAGDVCHRRRRARCREVGPFVRSARVPDPRDLRRVLLLVGSPKGSGSTSEALGSYLLILATPLYADSLPSGVTRLLEIVAAKGDRRPDHGGRRFAALINCGFPEARQCDTAIAICRCFAREAGMEWAGGLALGGGESIGGRPLKEAGGVAKNARKALDLAAEALSEGRQVPGEAVSLMARPTIPAWMYTVIGDIGWRLKARRRGTGTRMKDRPYWLDE